MLRGRRRDGLVDYLTTRWPTPFSGPDRLSEYFLVDVLVEGCARTSRVVSATSSVQLYVHRVLMNLERSEDWDPSATPPRGVFARFTSGARRDEWQWRRALPGLGGQPEGLPVPGELHRARAARRQDAAVLGARGRAARAGPRRRRTSATRTAPTSPGSTGSRSSRSPARTATSPAQTLHLFGVTQDDAPVYYYRAIDESGGLPRTRRRARYSPWHRVDLSIPVRKVSPSCTRAASTCSGSRTQRARSTPSSAAARSSPATGTASGCGTPRCASTAHGRRRSSSASQEAGGVADARIVEDPLDLTVVHAARDRDRAARRTSCARRSTRRCGPRRRSGTRRGTRSRRWSGAREARGG